MDDDICLEMDRRQLRKLKIQPLEPEPDWIANSVCCVLLSAMFLVAIFELALIAHVAR